MKEKIIKSNVEAQLVYYDEKNDEKMKGKCEIDLFETGFVIKPEKGDILRIPYSDISDIQDEGLSISISTEWGEKIIFSHLGKEMEPFKKTFSDIMNELGLKVQTHLKEMLPTVNSSFIRRLSKIMKEGKCAKKEDIDGISKDIWGELEKKILVSDIKEEYNFLKSNSITNKICIGIKRGLLGDLTGEYIWFLIPIYKTKDNEGGNVIAMESISSEEQGKATYFFKVVERNSFHNIKEQEFILRLDDFIKEINRAMLGINFRREPIYLSDEKLLQPQYTKYLFAIKKIPALQKIRKNFVGRVIHRSFEQWKEDVQSLLRFNISSKEDALKWQKE